MGKTYKEKKEPSNKHEKAESGGFERMEKRTGQDPTYTSYKKAGKSGKPNYKGR